MHDVASLKTSLSDSPACSSGALCGWIKLPEGWRLQLALLHPLRQFLPLPAEGTTPGGRVSPFPLLQLWSVCWFLALMSR